jgi:hypothetical protein
MGERRGTKRITWGRAAAVVFLAEKDDANLEMLVYIRVVSYTLNLRRLN